MTTAPLPRLVRIHKAMAHPARLRLLAALRHAPLCVCQVTAILELAGSTVSEHLAELRNAGLVADRKEGRWVEYRLSDAAARTGIFDALWPALESDPSVRADAVLLAELRKVTVEQLCSAGLDPGRLGRPKRAAAAAGAEKIRVAERAAR